MDVGELYTIGYSGFVNNLEGFIKMLQRYRINVLIDVRSSPYSGFFKEFNKDVLEQRLKKCGIYYRNYAYEFGAQQKNRELYPNGYLDFELFSKTDAFNSGVNKVATSLAKGYSIALMCAEKEPVNCHRAILVSKALSDAGYQINHILPDGKIKTQKDVEEKLLQMYPVLLFDDSDLDSLTYAYRKQNENIAYKLENLK